MTTPDPKAQHTALLPPEGATPPEETFTTPAAKGTTPLDDDFLSPEHVLPNLPHLPEPDLESPPDLAQDDRRPDAQGAAPGATAAAENFPVTDQGAPPAEDIPTLEIPITWEIEPRIAAATPADPLAEEASAAPWPTLAPTPAETTHPAAPGVPHASFEDGPWTPPSPEQSAVPTKEAAPATPPAHDLWSPSTARESTLETTPQEPSAPATPGSAAPHEEPPLPPPTAAAPPAPEPPSAPPPPVHPHIPVAPAPTRTSLVLDSTAGRFLIRGGELLPLQDHEGMDRWRLWLTDTRDTLGPGAVRVDAPPKYAPLLARRMLARGGEVDDTTTLRPLTRKRLGPNQTLLGFHLLSTVEETRLLRLHQRSAHGLLLHDTSTILYALLRRHQGTVGGLIQLPGTITAMVVRDGHILWGRRQMLAEDAGPAWETAVRALRSDMDLAARDAGFELESVLWIAGLTPTREVPLDGALALPVCALVDEKGTTHYSALPLAIDHLQHHTSLTPPLDRLAATLRPWEPLAWAAAILLGLFLGAGGFFLQETAATLAQQAELLARRKAELLNTLAQTKAEVDFPEDLSRQADGAFATAQAILRAETAPPLAAVWNELARIKPASCRITNLEIDYEGLELRLQLTGGLELPMTQAQAVFDAFQRDLTTAGYTVAAADLRFDLDGNAFTLSLARTFGE